MTHLDADTLALVALAELELSPAERQHLADCPACAGELDALRRTVLIGRSAGSVDLIEPADAVWGRIHAALGLSDAVVAPPRPGDLAGDLAGAELADADADAAFIEPAQASGSPAPAAPPAETPPPTATAARPDTAPRADTAPHAEAAPHAGTAAPHAETAPYTTTTPQKKTVPATAPQAETVPPAPVVDLPARRRRPWLPIAAAACAAGIVGGIAAGAWWQSTRAPAPEPVIAEAQLDALPGWTASGSASVEEAADGRRDVVVDLSANDSGDGLREVWLLTADASGLVSLGLLDGPTGRFSIPAGVDLAEYPVVDVSAEPADGNPAHSGDSIVRGTLSGS